MKAFAHDVYTYPLPPGHRFPLAKYRLVREGGAAVGVAVADTRAASRSELLLAHSEPYLDRVEAGALARREELALGLPWSPELVERARRSVGATLEAAEEALTTGVAANVGGGTHHAFSDTGRGFCVFNDVVVAVRSLRGARRIRRALIVDLDVHQGDGTHAAFLDDSDSFTFSVNGFRNYPFRRVPGDLELDLDDGAADDRYLDGLARLLPQAIARARADVCFYLAGADPYEGDRLGRLALSIDGLAERDRLVRDALARAEVPVCVTLAGGYADPIEDTVRINLTTLRTFASPSSPEHRAESAPPSLVG
ncbi:MAG: histone deacetylase [Actinomycetota bacterium]|nr:histone deacetylase [Actinomycetota bacterium]